MKNGRWVRIHEQGQPYEATNNVMDAVKGEIRNRAEVTYTANTRTIEKAVYWLLRYMNCSKAEGLYELTHTKIEEAAAATTKDDERLEVSDEKWNCTIEKIEKGVFKVSIDWTPEIEPIEFPAKKKSKKKATEAQANEASTEKDNEETAEIKAEGTSTTKKMKSKKNEEAAA